MSEYDPEEARDPWAEIDALKAQMAAFKELALTATADAAVLKIEVAALQELVIGLAIALAGNPQATLRGVAHSLEFFSLATRWIKGKETADGMRYIIDTLNAYGSTEPFLLLAARLHLYREAGEEFRAPLQSWLSQASPDEIADDVRQALKQLLAPGRGQSDDGESRDA